MREIKFRGVVSDECEFDGDVLFKKGQMVYGNLVYDEKGEPYILGSMIEVDNECTIFESWIGVDEKSVGQYTGLKDKNGKEIYEGDIVTYYCGSDKQTFPMNVVVPDIYISNNDSDGYLATHTYEVIGNIYENPELLT